MGLLLIKELLLFFSPGGPETISQLLQNTKGEGVVNTLKERAFHFMLFYQFESFM